MKNINITFFALLASIILLSSCGTTKQTHSKEEMYGALYNDHPTSIAIMPPINRTNNVEAKEFFYLTLSQPLSEQGYYVFPPFLTMEMFKTESAYDAEQFINGPLGKFKEVLGADAVLFTTINKWEKKAGLANTVNVEVEYSLRSTQNNEELFYRKGNIIYDASISSSGGGLMGALVNMAASAINTAATNHIKVARACNNFILSDTPAGTYSPNFGQDRSSLAGDKEFTQTIK